MAYSSSVRASPDNMNSHRAADPNYRTQDAARKMETPEAYLYGGRAKSNCGPNRNDQLRNSNQYVRTDNSDESTDLLKHLSNDFNELLRQGDLSDCIISVNKSALHVHQCILAARSNVFAEAIKSYHSQGEYDPTDFKLIKNGNKLVIAISDGDLATMKEVVRFIYTGTCVLSEHNAKDLLDAAGRYDIKSMKVYTGEYVIHHINSSNLLPLLKSSEVYGNLLVKQKCIEYFMKNAKEIMVMKDIWEKFAEEEPQIVKELLYWNIHSDEFLKSG